MEKRLFKDGVSSLALVVPKDWTEKNGLKPSGTVYMNEDANGDLVLKASQTKEKEAEEVLTSDNYRFIWRLIGSHYMYGTTKLRLYFKEGFTPKQLATIETTVREEYIGFEITNRTQNEIVLEDMTDMKDVSIKKIISRLRSLLGEELREMAAGNYESIPGTEELINRFYTFGVRYLNIVKPPNLYMHLRPIQLLEVAGDAVERLAEAKPVGTKALFGSIIKQFEASMKALTGDRESGIDALKQTDTLMSGVDKYKKDRFVYASLYDLVLSIGAIPEIGLQQERTKSSELLIDLGNP